MRPSGRAPDQLRPVSLEPGFSRHAEGSCLVKFGDTHVLCTASVDERVPPWLRNTGKGWVTAEYGMLPRSTHTRTDREAARGKQSGRTQEIQRLIGRSLRAVVDLTAMGERQINIDCDVLQADGGTRTAAITGAWVALHLAFERLIKEGKLAGQSRSTARSPPCRAACGRARRCSTSTMPRIPRPQADANFVLTGTGGIVEVQGTAEDEPFSEAEFLALLALAKKGIGELTRLQRLAIGKARDGAPLRRPKLVVATHNRGKAGEIRTHAVAASASRSSRRPTSACRRPTRPARPSRTTPRLKALAATRASGLPALADDSGLSVAALDGQPGRLHRRLGRPDARRHGRHEAHPGRACQAQGAGHRRRARRHLPLRAGAGLARRACRAGARHARRPHRLAAARQRRPRLRSLLPAARATRARPPR